MSNLNEIGQRDNWRCWLCDEQVDPDGSVNSDQGPSADSYAASKAKKGGREAVGRCSTKDDAEQASEWLLARLARLSPTTKFSTEITPGAGQFLLKLSAN